MVMGDFIGERNGAIKRLLGKMVRLGDGLTWLGFRAVEIEVEVGCCLRWCPMKLYLDVSARVVSAQ